MRIGVFHLDHYNWNKNITAHTFDEHEYHVFYDGARLIHAFYRRLIDNSEYLSHAFLPPAVPRVDLFHHWQTVARGRAPWVVSSSMGLPFGWKGAGFRRGLECLAAESCRRILLTGENARAWQLRKLAGHDDLREAVMSKVDILPPLQPTLVESWEDKDVDPRGTLRLAFVGKDFFRKGGLELVRVVDRLAREGADLHLTLVSALAPMPGNDHEAGQVAAARGLIDGCEAVTWHERRPHDEVLRLFTRSHVGVLPSHLETYGYTVLEAQAAGCATVTTNIQAFPDINPDAAGWRVDIDDEACTYYTAAGRREIAARLEAGLYRVLREALDDRTLLARKGRGALDRIRRHHDPRRHKQRLAEVYETALEEAPPSGLLHRLGIAAS